jgi:sialate O-acetylesterase
MTLDGSRMRVQFDHVGSGLVSRDGKPLNCFEVIDAETGGFVQADATIDGSSVVLSAKQAPHPVAVRFAWSKLAAPNLTNKEGLPALSFRAGDIPKRDAISFIAEARDYQLVYDLDLSKLGASIAYDVDNHSKITGTPDRIAYFLELQGGDGQQQYVYVSMDAFTKDLTRIAVPTAASGARFQQNVANMNVYSNVTSIAQGVGIKGGNIEFWPNNYGTNNAAGVPGASESAYDFGDGIGEPADGYGSMQVHNHDARQVIFAINNWKAAAGADIGIGNRRDQHTDWTFSGNAGSYTGKRLRVFVHTAR